MIGSSIYGVAVIDGSLCSRVYRTSTPDFSKQLIFIEIVWVVYTYICTCFKQRPQRYSNWLQKECHVRFNGSMPQTSKNPVFSCNPTYQIN